MPDRRVPGDREPRSRRWRLPDGRLMWGVVPPDAVVAAVDEALANVAPPAKDELDQLSERTLADLRLQLLKSLGSSEREVWAPVLAMQSSERTGFRLVVATWGLVFATVGLVAATLVLVWVTVAGDHGSQTSQPTQLHTHTSSQPHTRPSS